MKTNDNFYASAVDPNVASYSNIKDLPVSMDDLRDFSGILLLKLFPSKWPELFLLALYFNFIKLYHNLKLKR